MSKNVFCIFIGSMYNVKVTGIVKVWGGIISKHLYILKGCKASNLREYESKQPKQVNRC